MRSAPAVLLGLTLVSGEGLAQNRQQPQPASQTSLIVANAAIGGLTAGLWRTAVRRSFWRGFLRGAAAGTVVYAGKRAIGEGNAAGWWMGRQMAALGSSEVVNAAHGRSILESAVLPLGPVRIHVNRAAKRKISPRIDLASSAFVDVNLALPFQLGANGIIDYENRPWEREAVSIAKYVQ